MIIPSKGIGFYHRFVYRFRRYRERHMVDSGTRNTRFLCSKAEKRRIRFQITHICKAKKYRCNSKTVQVGCLFPKLFLLEAIQFLEMTFYRIDNKASIKKMYKFSSAVDPLITSRSASEKIL